MEHRWGIEVRLFKRRYCVYQMLKKQMFKHEYFRSQIRDLSEPSKEQEVKVPYLDKPITFPVRYSLLTADNLKKMQKAKDRVEQIKKTEEEKKLLESQSCLTAYAAQTEISTDDKCDENAQVSTEVGRNTEKANKHPKNTPTQTVSTQMPANVKMNLKKLMWLHPEGVWCRELQRLYKYVTKLFP